MTMECDRMGGVNLAQGVCDTEVSAPVAEGAIAAIREGHNIYTRLDGIARLRKAIAAKLGEDRGLDVDPDREVLVTSGATGALHAAAMALLNPGDEVILFEPFYGYHANTLTSMRMKPVIVPLAGVDWTLDLDTVRAAITPRTRAVLVNTPANPSGKIFCRAELEALAVIAAEHDLFIFTDEIYEYFLFGNAQHISPAMLDGMRERTVLMSGFSKTFSITGWRLGYLVADAKWVGAMSYFHDLTYVCAPSAFQTARPRDWNSLVRNFTVTCRATSRASAIVWFRRSRTRGLRRIFRQGRTTYCRCKPYIRRNRRREVSHAA